MASQPIIFREDIAFLGLVKFEADSEAVAESLLESALSFAQANNAFPTTFEVCAVVEDGGDLEEAMSELEAEALEQADAERDKGAE